MDEDQNRDNSKRIFMMFLVVILFALAISAYKFLESRDFGNYLKSSDEDIYVGNEVIASYENDEMTLDEFVEVRKKIDVKELFRDDYKYYYEVTNNSDEIISLIDVYLILYDEEYDKPCFVRMECVSALRAHSSAVVSFYVNEELIPIAGRREVFAIPDLNRSNMAVSDISIEYDLSNRDEVVIKNNGNQKVDHVEGTVVLFDKDGNIIEIEDFYTYDIKPHKSTKESLLLFSKADDVASFKIYSTAYSYKYDY